MMISKNQVKYIQSLGQKKSRDAENKFVAEGPKIVNELLNARSCRVLQVLALKESIEHNANKGHSAEVVEITTDELEKISQLSTPNQVFAVVEKRIWDDERGIKSKISLA